MNKNIIIAILVIVIIAIVGVFVFSQPQATTQDGKLNTQINFLSGDSLKNGEALQFELKDASSAAIAGAPVKITYAHDGTNETYSIITDTQGKGYLVINGEEAGSYDVTIDYTGDAKHNGCTAKKTITIEETTDDSAVEEAEKTDANSTASTVLYNNGTSSSGNNTSNDTDNDTDGLGNTAFSRLYYDEQLGVYYDDFGTIHGGDMDGNDVGELKDLYNHPNTDEYGNPQVGNSSEE